MREWIRKHIRHRHLFRVVRHIWPCNPEGSVYTCVWCGHHESWVGDRLEIATPTPSPEVDK